MRNDGLSLLSAAKGPEDQLFDSMDAMDLNKKLRDLNKKLGCQ
jgi:hypothetical protein